MVVHGLIIDPQEDFCNPATGTLFVPGAEADIPRLAQMLLAVRDEVDALHVTLDTHHSLHIAHPVWWQDAGGKHPAAFTIITADNVAAGVWRTTDPTVQARSREYVEKLTAHGRYPLMYLAVSLLGGDKRPCSCAGTCGGIGKLGEDTSAPGKLCDQRAKYLDRALQRDWSRCAGHERPSNVP